MTLDIDLPSRQYLRPINVARKLGATLVRNTIVELKDGTLINFIYEVTGVGEFSAEFRKAKVMKFHGEDISVMPLETIQKNKRAIQRPKDLVHLEYIAETLKMKRKDSIGRKQKNK